jgi:hypothetical protein
MRGRHLLEDYGRLVLPLSVFLFKFLEWWYSNENLISPPKRDPIPPPPELPSYLQRQKNNLKTGKEKTFKDAHTYPSLPSSLFTFFQQEEGKKKKKKGWSYHRTEVSVRCVIERE